MRTFVVLCVALVACGGAATPGGATADASSPSDGSSATDAPTSNVDAPAMPVDAAPLAVDAVAPPGDAGPAATDGGAPCSIAPGLPPVSPSGACAMPSGRVCAGTCQCDDGCNTCMCADGGLSMTDMACPMPPLTQTTCPAASVTSSCSRLGPGYDAICTDPKAPHVSYCGQAVHAGCGENACPNALCTAIMNDAFDGVYWCCP